jgi:HK97 gp10 family phage protein
MAQVDGIKVQGLNEALRALKAIGTPVAEVQAAAQQAGEIVASMSRTLVPVKSGKLRATIRAKKQARKVLVSAGNNTTVPYANPIHWGWYYDKNNFVKKNIMPQPFFAKALGLTRQEVYETYFTNMNKLFNKYYKNYKP